MKMVRQLIDLDIGRFEIIALFLVPACINIGIFLYVTFFLGRNRTNFAFSVFVLLLGLWQIADGFMRMAETLVAASEWFRICCVFSVFAIPFGILFTFNYSGNFRRISNIRFFITLFLPSLFCLVLLVARLDSFSIYASDLWYWISKPDLTVLTSIIYFWALALSLFMMYLLWENYRRENSKETRKKQALILAIGFTVPVVGGIIGKAFFSFILNIDVVPITTSLFTAFSVAALVAMRKYKLLDFSPKHQWDPIVEAMNEGLLIVNLDDQIMYANKSFGRMLDYDFEELKDKVATDLVFSGAEKPRDLAFVRGETRSGTRHEIKLRTKSGEEIWVSMSRSPYRDEKGRETGSILILSDINTLKRAETRFRTLIENSGDIIALTDKEGKAIYASPSFEKITGFTIDDMRNKASFTVMHPDQIEESRKALQEILDNPGKAIRRTNRYLHKDGHYVWLEGTVVNMLQHPDIGAIVSNYHDITDKRKTKEKLEQNEKWFRSLVEFGNDAIAILNEDNKIIYLSPNNEKILGYKLEEVYTPSPETIHPDDRANLMGMNLKSIEPGSTRQFEFRRLHKSGKWIWLEANATNLLHDPNIKGLIINYRDITERKSGEEKLQRSERIYKTIASSITGSVIIMIDEDYRYLLAEGDMLTSFGYTKEGLIGKRIPDVVSAERYAGLEEDLRRVFRGEFFTTETSRFGFDIITRYVPLHDENEKVYAALMVSIDISQLKKTQRQIAELNKDLEWKVVERTSQLEAANKELESFSYSVSHDLRAPLRAIHGYTQILQNEYDGTLDNEGKRLMGRVLVNTKKMGQLIDELLTFSRLGKKELARHGFSMKDLVQQVVKELRSLEGAREIAVRISDLPDVKADSTTIKQAWLNLVSNALKYTRLKERAEIEIGFTEDENEVTYFIKDNGAGFDMSYMDKLFGVFQRLHSEEEFEGIGVGLAIVQRIINKHGGRVWAEAKEDLGATFYFTLKKD
jgi:PAS domain S-box-containing protein